MQGVFRLRVPRCVAVPVSPVPSQIISKVGQGAFGSVYMAMWRGGVVAVKVMRQQLEGRRAIRTAWELAMARTLSHPHIVNVLAVYTDVAVAKQSRRVIRFTPPKRLQVIVMAYSHELLPVSSSPSYFELHELSICILCTLEVNVRWFILCHRT